MEPNDMSDKAAKNQTGKIEMAGWEQIQAELGSAKSIDAFLEAGASLQVC